MSFNTLESIGLAIALTLLAYSKISQKVKEGLVAKKAEEDQRKAAADKLQADAEEAKAMWRLMITNMGKLSETLQVDAADTLDAKKLLSGTISACEAIAKATTELRDEVGLFRGLIAAPKADSGYPSDNLTAPSAVQDERTATYIAALLAGKSPMMAQEEADGVEEKKTMLSAVSFGMEG